eukprot:108878_1
MYVRQDDGQANSSYSVRNAFGYVFSYVWSVIEFCYGFIKPDEVILFKEGALPITLSKQVAEGGFSFVYLGHDDRGRQYAIKKLLIQSPEQMEEARWELEVMKSISGSCLLRLIDSKTVSQESGASAVYMLFPFIENGTLLDHVQYLKATGRRMDETELLKMFRKVCEGVLLMHRHDPPWAHRDIKLNNILLDAHDRPVLMDFGSVSKARVSVNSRRDAVELQEWAAEHCTAPYRAPELFDCPSRFEIDERTDVWSLGCVLYGMAFSNSPFDVDEAGGSIALAVSSGHFDIPSDSKYSKSFQELIGILLQPDPAKRPYVDELLTRIDSLLQDCMKNKGDISLTLETPASNNDDGANVALLSDSEV